MSRSLVNNLDHRIELQSFESTEVNGFPTEKWTTFATVWAEKIPVSSKQYYAAAAVQKENEVRWRIRYRKPPLDISGKPKDWQDLRVVAYGKTYEITGDDDKGGKVELILITKEVTP